MPRFIFVPEEAAFDPGPLPEIDKTRKTALYIRQSGKKADTRHGESRETQLKLKEFATKLRDGDDSGVEVYDEKAGKSGTLDTHERPELQRLWNDITSGLIATIIVARLDRLYRDDIGDQYGAFMRLAKEQNVIVIVPALKQDQQHKYYDLNNREHRKAFRVEMEKAGSYIPENIAYLHKCRQQKRAKGFYFGGNLPPGLVLDRLHDKATIKPVIYEPWAREMRKIFARAKELRWNFALLIQELLAKPFIFPDVPDEDKARYIFRHNMTKVKDGYKVTPRVIREWFECLTLAGYWQVDEIHVRPNNHPAVINIDLFEEGYIHKTGEDLQGNPVGKKKRAKKNRASGEIPLVLRSVLTCPQADFISNQGDHYSAIKAATVHTKTDTVFTLHGPCLDEIVRDRLIAWSEADNTLADRIKEEFYKVHQEQKQSLASIKAALDEAESQREKKEERMAKAITDTLYNKLESELLILCEKIAKLQADIHAIEKLKGPEQIDEYYGILKNTRERYDKMTLLKKQTLWQLLTESVMVEMLSPHWVKLTINWIPSVTPLPDIAYIWRRVPSTGKDFSPEEAALLKEVYHKIRSRSELLQLFPERSYSTLKTQASRSVFVGEPDRIRRENDIPNQLCWLDVQAIADQEVSLAMAREAIAECIPTEEYKHGKPLHAIWCLSLEETKIRDGADQQEYHQRA